MVIDNIRPSIIIGGFFLLFIGNLVALDAGSTVAGIDVQYIQGGSYIMGSNDEDARIDEQPPHKVVVNSFAIMKCEVTVAEFKKFVDATGFKTDAEKGTDGFGSLIRPFTGPRKYIKGITWRCNASGKLRAEDEYNHPVIHVSYNDAIAYSEWLSNETGLTWRLPTEAEWEYAARGGENYKFSGSNNIDEVGWYTDNSNGGTNPVGQKKSNKFGLYDMTGNVWEMCNDWSDKKYYEYSAQNNPQGPDYGRGRILRGGSWSHESSFCRITFRHHRNPNARNCYNGFRLVLID